MPPQQGYGIVRAPTGDRYTADLVKTQAAVSVVMGGTLPFDEKTTQRISKYTADRQHDEQCPIRAPRHQALDGGGEGELIVGAQSGHDLFIWVYTAQRGRVFRIVEPSARPVPVEVTGGNLLVRERHGLADHERRTIHSWDERNQTLHMRVTGYAPIAPSRPGAV